MIAIASWKLSGGIESIDLLKEKSLIMFSEL